MLKDFPEETVGNRIRKQRLLKVITQKELAEFLDIPVEYFFDEYYEFVFGDYGERIKEWHVKNELTIKEAAVIVGVNANTLSKWERNIRYPDRIKYKKLIKIMCK